MWIKNAANQVVICTFACYVHSQIGNVESNVHGLTKYICACLYSLLFLVAETSIGSNSTFRLQGDRNYRRLISSLFASHDINDCYSLENTKSILCHETHNRLHV